MVGTQGGTGWVGGYQGWYRYRVGTGTESGLAQHWYRVGPAQHGYLKAGLAQHGYLKTGLDQDS